MQIRMQWHCAAHQTSHKYTLMFMSFCMINVYIPIAIVLSVPSYMHNDVYMWKLRCVIPPWQKQLDKMFQTSPFNFYIGRKTINSQQHNKAFNHSFSRVHPHACALGSTFPNIGCTCSSFCSIPCFDLPDNMAITNTLPSESHISLWLAS